MALARPLHGAIVNISISESTDSAGVGFPSDQTNYLMLQIAQGLLGQGVKLVFGHDWRDDGVMEAVYGLALRYQQIDVALGGADSTVPLRNFLAWPDKPFLSEHDLAFVSSVLEVHQIGLPPDLTLWAQIATKAGTESPTYKYCRARALTWLRRSLTERSDVRLCVGGRRGGAAGRYPGVVEEAFLSVQAGRSLYLSGLIGGVTADLIGAVRGGPMPDNFCQPTPLNDVYKDPPVAAADGHLEDMVIDRKKVWDAFASIGTARFAETLELTVPELEELFFSRSVNRVIEVVLTSMGRRRLN